METNGNNIIYYLEVFYRSKWKIVIPTVACTVIAAVIAISLPSKYRSSTLILVEQQQVPEAYVTPTDKTPFAQRLNTIKQQIMSRTNLEKIINDFSLYRRSEGGLISRISSKLGGTRAAPGKEASYERMAGDIDVKVLGDRRSEDAFSISYTGTNPYVTMQVTNSMASLFIEQSLKTREQYAEGTSDFLSNELENAKKELEGLEKAVKDFKERNMGRLPQQLEANLRTLDRFQMEVQTTAIELRNAEERRAAIETQISQTGAAGPGVVLAPEAELDRLQNELARLLSMYRDNYPDVVITRKRIAELKELLAKSNKNASKADEADGADAAARNPRASSAVAAANSQITALKQRMSDLKKQIALYEKRVEEAPAMEQRFTNLRRDYDISLKNYQDLLAKKLSARLAESLEKRQKGERFRVLDSANLPESPVSPNKPLIVLIGLLAGLGAGCGLVYALEFLSPSFRNKEELEAALGAPVLAVIPIFLDKQGGNN
ncbi:MAG: hypothetical protein HY889_10510 [Deltaproteobacteria bacterium]|nr:hypothetical protein [Deltaproteobacteria bacterium]